MGIKAAYMVPHPPLIVPEVGKGGEKQIIETTNAYDRVGQEIAKIALFLLSDESRYVHGEAIRADGGLVLHYIDAIANIYAHRRMDI